ncbi:MAG: SHOCT domain-containing protein [Phycisphaerales bacterium]|nr:MAG: SHOCT domain-containing protein [Phycisphaerales bacterium]
MVSWPAVMVTALGAVLAQSGAPQRHMRAVLVWGTVLLVLALVVGMGIRALRRRVFPEKEPPPDQLWTLEDLREMRERGQLSEEEFETLRARVIARMAGAKPGGGPRSRADASGSERI